MVWVKQIAFQGWVMLRATRWLCLVGVAAALSVALLEAQDQPGFTLHVFADTVQVPVLVLGPGREPIGPISASRFSVSLDGGRLFRATHVRLEADDPISLSILLDATGSDRDLLRKIDLAVSGLAPVSLRPVDNVTIYALDCSLIRTLKVAPAEQVRLKDAVDAGLQSWVSSGWGRHKRVCSKPAQLWDALLYMTHELSNLPGRRVILAVTNGSDGGSRYNWNQLRAGAQFAGVAIFGLKQLPMEAPLHESLEDPFNSVCELSGGTVIWTDAGSTARKLQLFVAMVRGRYIVEFPRPAKGTPGLHNLAVKIARSDAFIRTTGIVVPIVDPKVMADPTTVPSDPSLTPELGNRRILTTP